MSFIKRVIKKAIRVFTGCKILYKTNWYKSMFLDPNHEIYPDNVWYREHDDDRHLQRLKLRGHDQVNQYQRDNHQQPDIHE